LGIGELTRFSAVVEGDLDEVVLRSVAASIEAELGPVYGKRGKPFIREKLTAFNEAAKRSPWIVLVDLDEDADCAVTFREAWLPDIAPGMCFRVAVREVEAWLLADYESLAQFLRVKQSQIPREPEALPKPKERLVDIARGSRSKAVVEDMVPRPGSGRSTGPAYVSRLIEFVTSGMWRPGVAASNAPSLRSCIRCLERLG
jgi:hypothetical protein